MDGPRSPEQRKSATLGRLTSDADAWIASAEVVRDEPTKDAFASKHGRDPRNETDEYAFFRIVPDRVQALDVLPAES